MLSKFFCGCKKESAVSSSTLTLKQTLESFKEKEVVLRKNISIQVDRAKRYTMEGDKEGALKCIKRKKFYESQMEQLRVLQSLIRSMEQRMSQNVPVHGRQGMTSNSKSSLGNGKMP